MNNTHSNLFTLPKKVRASIAAVFTTLCLVLFGTHSTIVKAQEKTPNQSALEQQYQADLDLWTLQAYEGDRDAQFKIGLLFTNNQFNTADYQQAVYWYKQAARQGHALAQYNLGHQYLIGAGAERNENEAMAWWLKAAEQGHALSQFNVGRGYYLAIGLEKDDSKSKYWFKRAAMNNEPKAIETLVELGWAAPDEFNLAKKDSAEAIALTPVENPSTVSSASLDNATDNTMPLAVNQAAAQTTAPVIEKVTTEKLETKTPIIEPTKINNDSIAVFTNPNERAVLISILNTQANLVIKESKEEWTLVSNRAGLPVWIHQDFITVQGSSGTITGNKVNARSVPLVKNGTIVGRLNKGENVRILDQQEQWYRIMSPASFQAWVKTEDLQIKAEPTRLTDNKPVNTIASIDEDSKYSDLPVWVHQDFIAVQGSSGTITGNKVNVRSVPLVKNGTIVGRLNKGEKVRILEQQKKWFRVMSPSFKVRIKTEGLQSKTEPIDLTDHKPVVSIASVDENANSNEWLFKQSPSTFTLQLESFDNPQKIKGFKKNEAFYNNENIKIFTAQAENVTWSYFLHGVYPDSNSAKAAREEMGQSIAWIRTFGELQQNRCLAWKMTIPTPSMLNKYCA